MKIGMSYLLCNDGMHFLIPNILYHCRLVDRIVCKAHRPCKMLEMQLLELHKRIPSFFYLGEIEEEFSVANQTKWYNGMIARLIEERMDWAINVDEDEFYYGDLRKCVEGAETSGCNLVYGGGHCFYGTPYDNDDCNPVRRFFYRDPDGVKYEYSKPIFKLKNFSTTTDGNHFIQFNGEENRVIYGKFSIFHYTYIPKYRPTGLYGRSKIWSEEEVKEKGLVKDPRMAAIFDSLGIKV